MMRLLIRHLFHPLQILVVDVDDFRKTYFRRATWREVWDFGRSR